MECIMKIIKSLDYSGLLLKEVTETIQHDGKKEDFLVCY